MAAKTGVSNGGPEIALVCADVVLVESLGVLPLLSKGRDAEKPDSSAADEGCGREIAHV